VKSGSHVRLILYVNFDRKTRLLIRYYSSIIRRRDHRR